MERCMFFDNVSISINPQALPRHGRAKGSGRARESVGRFSESKPPEGRHRHFARRTVRGRSRFGHDSLVRALGLVDSMHPLETDSVDRTREGESPRFLFGAFAEAASVHLPGLAVVVTCRVV